MDRLKYFLFIPINLLFLLIALPAAAFEISPVKILLTVNPGASETVSLSIKNFSSSKEKVSDSQNFKLSVLGMSQDQNGLPIFSRSISEAESWVFPESSPVYISTNETKTGNFIIKVPNEAQSGSYYLGLAVEPVLKSSNPASLATRLVSLLTLQVKGLIQESLSIETWSLDSNWRSDMGIKNLQFDLNFKNNGNIELLTRGIVTVKNWKGEDIFSEPIILGNKLLAGSKRSLQPEVFLKNPANLPGIYSAYIKINYGRTNQSVSAVTYIWYFPTWSKIALFLAVAILFGLLIFFKFRRKTS